jgi:lysophospholipase L1-like esterase
MEIPRREFIKGSLVAGLAPTVLLATQEDASGNPGLASGSTILFQGDSITDGGRWKGNDWNHILGQGYAFIIDSKIGYQFPSRGYVFVNRGVSGNTISNLAARWEEDAVAIKPQLISILVGVNDTMKAVEGNVAFSPEYYAKEYRSLLQKTVEHLPGAKLVIGEPFLLPVERLKDKWTRCLEALLARQEIARKLAVEFDAAFVSYQELFTASAKKAANETWLWDGVHPMPAGHELMAVAWIKAVNKKFKFF